MNSLIDILKGCLYSHSVNQAQSLLAQYSQKSTFLQQLLVLIPNQEPPVLIMILSTIKNYMLARWNPPPQKNLSRVPTDQKLLFMQNVFNLFYEIKQNEQAVNLYKQILHMMILVDYPWQGLQEQLQNDMNGQVIASIHFCRQIAKAYEYSSDQIQRKKAQYFVSNYFPKLEVFVEQCMSNFNSETSKLLHLILKTFFSTIHIDLPEYLKNQGTFIKWYHYISTLLTANLPENSALVQKISSRILSRVVNQYMNQDIESKNLKGWNQSLREKIAQNAINCIFCCLSNPNCDEDTVSNILQALMGFAANQKLRIFLNEQSVSFVLYDRLLPNMETSSRDLQLFQKEPLQYVSKDQDLTSEAFKRNAADTIQRLLNYCSYGDKSQMMKFIEYSAASLRSNNTSDRHKQVLIRQLTKMSSHLKKNTFIKQNFQMLTNTYFLPLLKVDAPLLNAQICRFFAAYLDDMKLSENTVRELMSLIYEKMIGKYQVLKYNGILAFTSLLKQPSALNSAKSHFQSILQIYVKMLDSFDHQNLLACLEKIISNFSNEIVGVASNLIEHLINKFYQSCNKDQAEDENEDDNSKQAIAALSTIEQILECPLSDEVYYEGSKKLIPMMRQIFDDLQGYFSEVLSLINVLVYKSKRIVDEEVIYVLCRKLLEGNNFSLPQKAVGYDVANLVNKITETSDTEYEANLISILKNLIQKMPDNILYKYQYPVHSELILALIENKRILFADLAHLNTSMVDNIWKQYLQSYKFIVYGEGQVTNPQFLKSITGVSLYPWLMCYFDVNLVKIVLSQIQDQEQQNDDDYYEENTMMMLQKYAKEDDDDEQDCDEYYGTEGVNYTFLYDSPFDSSKDRQIFKEKLKQLSQQDANALMGLLNSKDKKRLEVLFN